MSLLALASPSPASSYSFVFVGDGSSQHMSWYWSNFSTTFSDCLQPLFSPCGDFYSAGGEIPMTVRNAPNYLVGGMVDWTAAPNSLRIVAFNALRAFTSSSSSWTESWTYIDLSSPLVFQLVADAGDSPNTLVRITPRLNGHIEQFTDPGSSTNLQLEYQVSVSVSDETVTSDFLSTSVPVSGGTDLIWTPALSNPSSQVTVGARAGSYIAFSSTSYTRPYASGVTSRLYAFCDYGDGLALVIDAEAIGPVAVGEQPTTAALRLAIQPRPAARQIQVQYALPAAGHARLTVFDMAGRKVRRLLDSWLDQGPHVLSWDGGDESGARVAPGVYWVELVGQSGRRLEKAILLRP